MFTSMSNSGMESPTRFDSDPFFCQTFVELFYYGTRRASYIGIEQTLSKLLRYVSAKGGTAKDISLLIRLILYSRDATQGKGERTLTYALLFAMYPYHPAIVLRILTYFVYGPKHTGGWVDARRLSEYVYSRTDGNTNHPIIRHAVFMINNHLYMDKQISTWSDATHYLSTVSRWIPRESSSSSQWLFDKLAHDWCLRYTPYLLPRPHSSGESQQRAIRKYKGVYRQMVSRLTAMGPSELPSRGLGDWVVRVREILRSPFPASRLFEINREWEQTVKGMVGNTLPVIDISRGMDQHTLMSAIGVACLLLETTTLKKRVLTIDQTPTWVIIPDNATFTDTVSILLDAVSRYGRTSSRIERGIQLLDASFQKSGMTRAEIRGMTIVLLLDMSQYETMGVGELDESIRTVFGHSTPHLVYWNVCSQTDGGGGVEPNLVCEYDRYGANVVSGDGFQCLSGILPLWRVDAEGNKQYVYANRPYDGVVSVLSGVDISFFDDCLYEPPSSA